MVNPVCRTSRGAATMPVRKKIQYDLGHGGKQFCVAQLIQMIFVEIFALFCSSWQVSYKHCRRHHWYVTFNTVLLPAKRHKMPKH